MTEEILDIDVVSERASEGVYGNGNTLQFEVDLVKAIKEEYGLNTKQAELVYRMSYEEGHSSGYHEIINYVYDFGPFAKYILSFA